MRSVDGREREKMDELIRRERLWLGRREGGWMMDGREKGRMDGRNDGWEGRW